MKSIPFFRVPRVSTLYKPEKDVLQKNNTVGFFLGNTMEVDKKKNLFFFSDTDVLPHFDFSDAFC